MLVGACRFWWVLADARGCSWVLSDARGFLWKLVDAHGFLQILVGDHRFSWMLVGAHGFWWVLVDARGCLWILVGARGCSWVLVDSRRLRSPGHGHSAPQTHLPSLPGASGSARAVAVYCLIMDIILQMAFGPANGITGVILLLVNYNQFVWDAFPVFVCNCSPRSPMTVTQQKLRSFAQG